MNDEIWGESELERLGMPASGTLRILKHKDGTATLIQAEENGWEINRGRWAINELAKRRKEILISWIETK